MAPISRSARAIVAGCAALAVALTGCGSSQGNKNKASDTGSGASQYTKFVNMYQGGGGAFTENYNPLSPAVINGMTGWVYEPLFYYNPLGKLSDPPKPMLGTESKWSADGKQLDITTRSGVTWSDGQPFTAKDVAFTFNLISNTPALNTSGTKITATATDDTHVKLVFTEPNFTNGPNLMGRTSIVPEHIWSKMTGDVSTNINKGPVGTGPFVVDSFTPQAYTFKRNPHYWQEGLPKVGGVRVLALNGNEAGVSNLLNGKLDYTSMFIPTIDKVLKAHSNLSYTNTGNAQVVLATCSSAAMGCKGPQTDLAVRKAIYYAVDRTQLNKLAFAGLGSDSSPAFTLLNRDEQFTDASLKGTTPTTADVSKSDQLLQGDGWAKKADGYYYKNGKKLSLTVKMVTGWTDYISAADTMAQQLKKAGIELISQQVAYNEFTNSGGNGSYQLVVTSLTQGPAPDPWYVFDTYFNGVRTGKVGTSVNPYQNISRYSNPTVNAAIKAAGGTTDVAKKTEQFFTIEKQIAADIPYIPLITSSGLTEYSSTNFTGWPTQDNVPIYPMSWSTFDSEQILLGITEK